MFPQKSLDVLKMMVESFGPSGFERETSRIIKDFMEPYCDTLISDKLGTTAYVAKGTVEHPRVLLAGHIDEVGFVVSGIDEKTGFLTFNTLGGWWSQVLIGQRVVVRTNKGDLYGVIAAKPPHLLSDDERKKVVEIKDMYLDIGVSSKEAALDVGVQIGNPVVPWSPFTLLHGKTIAMGKAFDDRIGAFVIMEAIRRINQNAISHPNTVYGAATVQEEVGLRGAQTIANLIDPDVAFVLEVDIAGDVPGIKPPDAPSKLGKGPALLTFDRSMIPNQPLKEFVMKTAENANIPIQLSHTPRGGTDAGRIHLNRAGCPSIVIGVPTRHIHSHVGLLNLHDVDTTVRLLIELLKKIDGKTVDSFTAL
jgi:endoglucanase